MSETQRFITHASVGCVGFRYTNFQEREIEDQQSLYK